MLEFLGPALGLVGGLMGGDDEPQQQTASKEPWAEAAPWLKQNIQTGQNLQNHYQANPFNNIQQAAFQNLLGQSDYFQGAMPSLMSQLNRPVGFDRSNPRAKPPMVQFPGMGGGMQGGGMTPGGGGVQGGMQGLLGNMNQSQNPFAAGLMAPPAPPPAAPMADPRQTYTFGGTTQYVPENPGDIGANYFNSHYNGYQMAGGGQ